MTKVVKHLFLKNWFQKFHSVVHTHINHGGILSMQPAFLPPRDPFSLASREDPPRYITFSVLWSFSALLTFPGLCRREKLWPFAVAMAGKCPHWDCNPGQPGACSSLSIVWTAARACWYAQAEYSLGTEYSLLFLPCWSSWLDISPILSSVSLSVQWNFSFPKFLPAVKSYQLWCSGCSPEWKCCKWTHT